MKINQTFGLALCGGGARGMAHIGLLKALEERGHKPSAIAGTSAGAIVASLYASGISIAEMIEVADHISMIKLVAKGINLSAMTDLKYLEKTLVSGGVKPAFDEFFIPCYIGVTDIMTGKAVYLSEGNVSRAVKASCSIPGVFKPVEINSVVYVDGGLVENLPVTPLKIHGMQILGSNVNALEGAKPPHSFREVTNRSLEIVLAANSASARGTCSYVFDLEGVYGYDMFNFGDSSDIIEIGYQNASRILDKLALPSE